MATLFNIEPLIPILESGATVLTPNTRMRNHIHRAYCEYFQTNATHASTSTKSKNPFVLAPDVLSLPQWLQQQWSLLQYGEYATNQAWLNDFQRISLWQQVISQNPSTDTSLIGLSLQKLVRFADEAHRNMRLWQVSQQQLSSNLSSADYLPHETSALLKWAQEFEKNLRKNNFSTEDQVIEQLLKAFSEKQLQPVEQLHLQSFDNLAPLLEGLFKQASKTLTLSNLQNHPSTINSSIVRTCAESYDDETLAAAQWSWQMLQNNPKSTIGIIVPDLGTRRDAVERRFVEVFEAHSLLPDHARYPLPFNISTGTPLGKTALVQDTLAILKLSLKKISLEDACHLLHSPFFGDTETEYSVRANVATRIKKLQQQEIRVSQLRHSCHQESIDAKGSNHDAVAQRLNDLLQKFAVISRSVRFQSHPLHTWVNIFQELLNTLGWPGTRPLDSVEYQQLNQWHKLLESLVTLDAVLPSIGLTQALNTLEELASSSHFQTQVKASPIHILGTLEAEGLRFDHCWMMGFDSQRWPPKPKPNPLLPFSLQRELGMPRGSHQRELEYSQKLTLGFLQSTKDIVVSYAARNGDDSFEPSPLVKQLKEIPLEDVLSLTSVEASPLSVYKRQLESENNLQYIDDEFGPAFINSPQQRVKGGTTLLSLQANCPFNAFARTRLGALKILEPQFGLSAILRGNLLHAALATLWQQLGDQSNLKTLDSNSQSQLIDGAITEAIRDELKYFNNELGSHYLSLEQQRLHQIISNWLNVEKQRPPFRVLHTEIGYEAEFDHLNYKLRIDRIDQLESGKLLLIDYKTGKTSINNWLTERPIQPQLPLYSLTFQREQVCGIAFAEVNAKKQCFVGVAELSDAESISGISSPEKIQDKLSALTPTEFNNTSDNSNFSNLQSFFNKQLSVISQEYQQGYAAVEFNQTNAPQYDEDLLPLNRYPELDFLTRSFSSIASSQDSKKTQK